ncbi:DUF2259 domain-containing protein [Phyllobacterium salinisoli]|uniref:DUF2259 domain-containing protein n=1 Tax=Phyllobacterium salinisoli TaxID=1899321 RepID=A0A368K4T4_9HYPH|nr:DUF2259 domain-containing protein [Phyllobacterium salinisoli]RCS24398.1 DUF2259 domain-containing protein [Phyllobacterium salinisoli]
MRTNLAALALLVSGACAAHAGDAASLDIIGFSKDGGIFAFEESGIQDGSGFPYANRFYISTENDSFLPGTPVRIVIDRDDATIDEARREARGKGETAAHVGDDELRAHAGKTVASNPVTELSADPFRVVVNPRPVFPAIDAPLEYRLSEIPLAPPAPCKDLSADLGEMKGFRLVEIDPAPNGKTRLLHEDKNIPASRACPLGYSIGAVQITHDVQGPPAGAILVAVRSIGFEGPNHRWLAVTKR